MWQREMSSFVLGETFQETLRGLKVVVNDRKEAWVDHPLKKCDHPGVPPVLLLAWLSHASENVLKNTLACLRCTLLIAGGAMSIPSGEDELEWDDDEEEEEDDKMVTHIPPSKVSKDLIPNMLAIHLDRILKSGDIAAIYGIYQDVQFRPLLKQRQLITMGFKSVPLYIVHLLTNRAYQATINLSDLFISCGYNYCELPFAKLKFPYGKKTDNHQIVHPYRCTLLFYFHEGKLKVFQRYSTSKFRIDKVNGFSNRPLPDGLLTIERFPFPRKLQSHEIFVETDDNIRTALWKIMIAVDRRLKEYKRERISQGEETVSIRDYPWFRFKILPDSIGQETTYWTSSLTWKSNFIQNDMLNIKTQWRNEKGFSFTSRDFTTISPLHYDLLDRRDPLFRV